MNYIPIDQIEEILPRGATCLECGGQWVTLVTPTKTLADGCSSQHCRNRISLAREWQEFQSDLRPGGIWVGD